MIKVIDSDHVIESIHIIGTETVYFRLWKKFEKGDFRASSITSFDDLGSGWYGRVGTDPELSGVKYDHLPVSPERTLAVRKAYAIRYDFAYDTIKKYVEFIKRPDYCDGEIRCNINDLTGEWKNDTIK